MHNYSALSRGLRDNLLAVLGGAFTHQQLTAVIQVCHALASAFLSGKKTARTLTILHGISHSDLAYDCIAEIFQQDRAGHFVQLQGYFNSLCLETASDEETLVHLRRLVFSKVNQAIFRLYHEADPALAKILRNIKLAIYSLQHFVEVERFGETCIAPSLCETLEHLPAIDREELERDLLELTTGAERIPDLLAILSVYLRQQTEHCRIVPLVAVAFLFRSIYTSKHYLPRTEESSPENTFVADDTMAIIQRACGEIRKQMEKRYVAKGKVPKETFEQYFKVIETGLRMRYVDQDGQDFSLYESLRNLVPDLSKEDYYQSHKDRLEYLSRLTDELAIKRLKELQIFSN
jgi:hypothetical protein